MVFFAAAISLLDLIIFYVVRDAIFSSRLVVVSPHGSINGFAHLAAADFDELAPLLESQPTVPTASGAAGALAPRLSAVLADEHTRAELRFALRRESLDSSGDGALVDSLDVGVLDDAETVTVDVPSSSSAAAAKPVRPSLARLCERMSRRDGGVSVGDRVDVFRTHKMCFVGSEAIDWMVMHVGHLFPTRRLALDVAQELLAQRFIASATCQCGEGECECVFRDSSRAFYRFQGGAPSAPIEISARARAESSSSVPPSPAVAASASPAVAMTPLSQLQQIAAYASRHVTVGDRLVQLSAKSGRRYIGVVTGRALCDWFMATYMRHERYLAEKRVSRNEFRVGTPIGDALIGDEAVHLYIDARGSSRDAAVALGQALLDDRLLFHSTDGRRFVDTEVFFSFHPTQLEVLTFDAAPQQRTATGDVSQKARQFSAAELDGLAQALAAPSGVKQSDHAYRLSDSETRAFKNVFAANDAVRWLVEHQLSRENAIRALSAMVDAGLVKHAASESKGFVAKDGEYYRFNV